MTQSYVCDAMQVLCAALGVSLTGTRDDLADLLPQADVVIVTASQNASNVSMVGEAFLSCCKCASCLSRAVAFCRLTGKMRNHVFIMWYLHLFSRLPLSIPFC
jgi:hypothetical protein